MTQHDDLTTRLRRQLHEQADDWHGAPLTLETVRGRAHAIRRRRAALTAGAVVAAVTAILVPTALLGDSTGRADRDPAPVDTPSGAVEDASGVGVPYLEDHTLTMPDGTERRLIGTYDDVVVWDEKVLGLRRDPATSEHELDRVADDGTVEETVELGRHGITRTSDGSAIAYTTRGGDLVVEWADGQVDLGDVGDARPLRLLGGPDCTGGADDCVVYYADGRRTRFLSSSGETAEVAEDALAVHDVSESGLISVLTSVDEREPGSCSEIRDSQTSETVRETCDHTPSRFSPDGSYLTALPPYLSGIGPSEVAILDALSGEELAAYRPRDGYVSDFRSVWEDADHLLVMAHDAGAWSVVRLGVDGSQERVLGPRKGSEMTPPWVLAGPG